MHKYLFINFLFLATGILFCSQSSYGQDLIPSQFHSLPMVLNPSLVNGGERKARVGFFHRSQWRNSDLWFGNSYAFSRYGFFADFHFADDEVSLARYAQDNCSNLSRFGLGVIASRDQTVGNTIGNLNLSLAGSFTQPIGENHALALGIQLELVQKRFDIGENVIFENMVGPDGVIPGSTSGEVFQNSPLKPDFSWGLSYSGGFMGQGFFPGSQRLKVNAGFAMTRMLSTFGTDIAGVSNQIPEMAINAHLSTGLTVGEVVMIEPQALYLRQVGRRAETWYAGAMVNYLLDEMVVGIGAFHRWQESVSVQVDVDIRQWHLGLSYDMAVSNIETATRPPEGFEVSAIVWLSKRKQKGTTPCPRFNQCRR